MTTEQELDELFALGHEIQRVEFKPAGSRTDRLLQARVVRAAMAMANRRNGGLIIVGSEDLGQDIVPVGLDDDQLTTWSNDHVSDLFSNYADPSIQFQLEITWYRGRNIVVIHVDEFDEIPVLCKRHYTFSGRVILRQGACYVRSRGKPESAEVSTQEDMRALLELATDKKMKKRVESWVRDGILVSAQLQVSPDSAEFDSQLTDSDL